MPSAGLQMFGAGLQLQPVTPGVKNIGNANVSGTLLAAVFGNNQFNPDTTLSVGKRNTFDASYTGGLGDSNGVIVLGQGNTVRGGTNNLQSTMLIGSGSLMVGGPTPGSSQSTYVGISQSIQPAGFNIQKCSLFGYGAFVSGSSGTNASGFGTSVTLQSTDSSAFGYLTQVSGGRGSVFGSTAKSSGAGDNCVFGYGSDDRGNANVTVLGSNNILAIGRSNACVVGNSGQTDCQVGPYKIAQTQGNTTKIADANYTILPTDGIVMMTSITAARTWTMPSAASVPAGTIIRVLDMSGSVTGLNNITILPAGTDTIVGPGTPAINSGYGANRLMSDGVSKWLDNNNF